MIQSNRFSSSLIRLYRLLLCCGLFVLLGCAEQHNAESKRRDAGSEGVSLRELLLRDPTIKKEALAVLRSRGEACVPELEMLLQDGSSTVSKASVAALSKVGGTRAAHVLINALSVGINSTEITVALQEMGESGRRAIPALLDAIQREKRWSVRVDLVHGLAAISTDSEVVIDLLLQNLTSEDMYSQEAADIEALKSRYRKLGEKAPSDTIRFMKQINAMRQKKMINDLRRFVADSQDVRLKLIQMLDAPAWDVRKATAEALWPTVSSSMDELTILRIRLLGGEEWKDRRKAFKALLKTDRKASLRFIKPLLFDEREGAEVCRIINQCMSVSAASGSLWRDDMVPILEQVVQRAEEGEVAIVAGKALPKNDSCIRYIFSHFGIRDLNSIYSIHVGSHVAQPLRRETRGIKSCLIKFLEEPGNPEIKYKALHLLVSCVDLDAHDIDRLIRLYPDLRDVFVPNVSKEGFVPILQYRLIRALLWPHVWSKNAPACDAFFGSLMEDSTAWEHRYAMDFYSKYRSPNERITDLLIEYQRSRLLNADPADIAHTVAAPCWALVRQGRERGCREVLKVFWLYESVPEGTDPINHICLYADMIHLIPPRYGQRAMIKAARLLIDAGEMEGYRIENSIYYLAQCSGSDPITVLNEIARVTGGYYTPIARAIACIRGDSTKARVSRAPSTPVGGRAKKGNVFIDRAVNSFAKGAATKAGYDWDTVSESDKQMIVTAEKLLLNEATKSSIAGDKDALWLHLFEAAETAAQEDAQR